MPGAKSGKQTRGVERWLRLALSFLTELAVDINHMRLLVCAAKPRFSFTLCIEAGSCGAAWCFTWALADIDHGWELVSSAVQTLCLTMHIERCLLHASRLNAKLVPFFCLHIDIAGGDYCGVDLYAGWFICGGMLDDIVPVVEAKKICSRLNGLLGVVDCAG